MPPRKRLSARKTLPEILRDQARDLRAISADLVAHGYDQVPQAEAFASPDCPIVHGLPLFGPLVPMDLIDDAEALERSADKLEAIRKAA